MLSIVVPAYNHAAYIEEAISKVRKIPVPGKRIVVIDDASTDNTAEVVERYLEREGAESIKYIRKPINMGLVHSLNMFLDLCETEYVYMIASDDVVVPTGVRTLLDELVAKPRMGFVIGGGKNLFEDGRLTPIYGRKHDELFDSSADQLLHRFFLRDVSPLLLQSTVFRLQAIRDVGGFDTDLVADDYALFAKIFRQFSRRGMDFEFKPDIDCVRYRHHGSNSYRNLERQARTNREVIYRFAPAAIKNRAVGYRCSLFMLIGMKHRRFASVVSILRIVRIAEIPWVAVGVFINAYQWCRNQR